MHTDTTWAARCGEPLLTRRRLLAAAAVPMLSSCAIDFSRYRGRPMSALAAELGVCAASYVVLRGGRPEPGVSVGGCDGVVVPGADAAVFQAASLTKPLVAYRALHLVEQGRLDLEAPVSRYLPEGYRHFRRVLEQRPGSPGDYVPAGVLARIPVGTLLSHTSGLPNWTAGRLAPEFEPGERWQYSGEGYVLLQRVVERITGESLSDDLDVSVLQPLRMRDTSLVWQDAFAARFAPGGSWSQVRFRTPVAAASLYTTAPDYARFLAALLANKPLIALTMDSLVTVDAAIGLAWGRGWGVLMGEGGPYLWQWGNNPGFRAFAMVSIESQDGFVLLTNSDHGMPLAAALVDTVLPGAHAVFSFALLG